MIKKILRIGGILTGLFSLSVFAYGESLSFQKEGKSLLISTPYYKATILPERGGRISSLLLSGTPNNFVGSKETNEGFGIGKGAETNCWIMFMERKYNYKIEKEKNEMNISLSISTYEGLKIRKVYTFYSTKPEIKVSIELENIGESTTFGYRVHNGIKVGRNEDENDIFFLQVKGKLKEVPYSPNQDIFIRDFSSDWAGVYDKRSKESLIFKADYQAISQFYFWMGDKGYNIEFYYRTISLDKGDIWKTTYLIFPLKDFSPSRTAFFNEKLVPASSIVEGKREREEKKESLNILWVGNMGSDVSHCHRFCYNLPASLKTLPLKDVEISTFEIVTPEGIRPYGHYLKGFPISAKRLLKYDLIIFEDVSYWALKQREKNIISYIEKGGNLIFLGDHGRGYRGSLLSNIIPLSFDYGKEVKGAYSLYMNDKGNKEKVAFLPHPTTSGLPSKGLPSIFVHKGKVKEGQILMKAGEYPALVIKRYGKGNIISFPISFTKELPGVIPYHIKHSCWDNNLIRWDFYDELWRDLVYFLCNKRPEVLFSQFEGPGSLKKIIGSFPEVKGEIKNNSPLLSKEGKVMFFLNKDEKKIEKVERDYFLKPEEKRGFSYIFKKVGPFQGKYRYQVDIVNKEGKVISYRDSSFYWYPERALKVKLLDEEIPSLANTFTQGKDNIVNLSVRITGFGKGETKLKTILLDEEGNLVKGYPEEEIFFKKNLSLNLGNISAGRYTLRASLLEEDKEIDRVDKEIYIVTPLDWEDYFPIVTFYQYHCSTKEVMRREVDKMLSLGYNGVLYEISVDPRYRDSDYRGKSKRCHILCPEKRSRCINLFWQVFTA